MKRSAGIQMQVAIVTPLVVAGIAAGLWLAVSAARENIKFARATDQILGAVATALEMETESAVSPERATSALLERLVRFEKMQVVLGPQASQRYMINPWGGRLNVAVHPSPGIIAFETSISTTACRRMIEFFAKDAASLRISRIDVRDEELEDSPARLLYSSQQTEAAEKLTPAFIRAGCGEGENVVLGLTFGLR